jgi:diadenylate cyclase
MKEILEQFNVWAVIDILFISIIIYHILILIKGTKTAQTLSGIVILFFIFLASSFFPLTAIYWILNKFYSSIILILVILFQEDIRNGLSRIGKKYSISHQDQMISNDFLDEIPKAAIALASKNIGALIAIERSILLNRYVDIGTLLDAKISKEILLSIFHPSSPIHDGAIIIQQGRISAAGCFLPLTRQVNLAQHMGTRHRAAIGLSQETDALVILVSEERGSVSIAMEGILYPCSDDIECKNMLIKNLSGKYSPQHPQKRVVP